MIERSSPELSIVMPCLNEALTVATCIEKAKSFLRRAAVDGEIIIADNGSTDGSQTIAAEHGAIVVPVPEKGYGSALLGGFAAARGHYIVMGDADDSYDFASLDRFVEELRRGRDLVMGNRFQGGIKEGAMPPLHRFFGNPVLSGIGRLFFKSPVGDFYCGLRGFRRDALPRMDLHTTGMELASEMVVKATLLGLDVTEVPTTLWPDGRNRPPHLRSWRDGWQGLRFMLLYSPKWLFLYPGIVLMIMGLAGMTWLVPTYRRVGDLTFGMHTLLYFAIAVQLGFQTIWFWAFTRIFAANAGLLPRSESLTGWGRKVTLEFAIVVGILLVLLGFGGSIYAVQYWEHRGFGRLDPRQTFRIVIPSVVALTLGVQIILSSFFLSVLGLKQKGR